MATTADIQTIVNGLFAGFPGTSEEDESPFAKLVRSSSILLNRDIASYDDIRRITPSVYHRIFLRVATGRDTTNIFLYNEDDVIQMLDPLSSAGATEERFNLYGGDIQWCAAKLVGAHLLRTIPLNNSSLKFKDVADNLEVQALEDVDRIIKLINTSTTASTKEELATSSSEQISLYIAHELNKNTIPETAFNTPDANSTPPTYEQPVNLRGVETYSSIQIPNEKLAYCHVYMTGQAVYADQDLITSRQSGVASGGPQNSSSVSYAIRLNIPLENNWTIDDIIIEISDAINSACLSSTNSTLSNIICTPERGRRQVNVQTAIKKELYPSTTTFRDRQAVYDLDYRVNKLNFSTRRYSNKVNTEMFTITFFTIDNPSTINPESSSNYTDTPRTIGTTDSLSRIKSSQSSFKLGVEGLVFGQVQNYTALDKITPRGFFLTVQKGDKASVSIETATSGGSTPAEAADSLSDSSTLNTLDTFYFYAEDNTVFTQPLILRVASTKYSEEAPINIEVDLSTVSGTSIGEQVAEKVIDAIYNYTQVSNSDTDANSNSNILGVLLGDYEQIYTSINQTTGTVTELPLEKNMDSNTVYSNLNPVILPDATIVPQQWEKDAKAGRVQIVGFKYTKEEYRIVLDVLQVPNGLEIAIGNYILRKTSWSTRRRSLQVEAKTLSAGNTATSQTVQEELQSVNASVSKAKAEISPILQNVYDKQRLLKEGYKLRPWPVD